RCDWMLVGESCGVFCSLWRRVVFFFFSSRRRHTRLVSDWSSDVCSSDLKVVTWRSPARITTLSWVRARASFSTLASEASSLPTRSEERRVGKEDRGGGAPEH